MGQKLRGIPTRVGQERQENQLRCVPKHLGQSVLNKEGERGLEGLAWHFDVSR